MKYSKEKVKEICKYVMLGMKYEDAAHCADISEPTFYEWKNSKPEFLKALNDAVMKGKVSNLAIIHRAKQKDWTAAKWLLAVRHADEFGYKNRTELTGINGAPVQIQPMTGMAFEDMERLESKLDAVLKTIQTKQLTDLSPHNGTGT